LCPHLRKRKTWAQVSKQHFNKTQLQDDEVLAKSLIATKLEQIETLELKAEDLREVLCADDTEVDVFSGIIEHGSGNLKIKPGKATIPMPAQNQHWNQSTPEDEKPDRANTHNTTNAQHLQVQADDLYKDQDASKRFPPINLKAPQHRKDLHHYEKLYQARSYHQQGA